MEGSGPSRVVLGISASGVANHIVLLTGLAGLLAGALSMGAGEYVSVRSQRELLEASTPSPDTGHILADLNVDANELSLLYRSRGMSPEEAGTRPTEVLAGAHGKHAAAQGSADQRHEAIGTGMGAAVSSFCFFASGAIIPVLPYLLGLNPGIWLAPAGVRLGRPWCRRFVRIEGVSPRLTHAARPVPAGRTPCHGGRFGGKLWP